MRALILFLLLSTQATAQDAVGRLNAAGYNTTRMCSGALIAPDLVLTAAHCVADPTDGTPQPIRDMVFVAGWTGAGHAGASKVAGVTLHPQAFDQGRFDLRHDVALVRLTTPLDIPPLAIGTALAAGPLTLWGYPRTTPHRLRVQEGCTGASHAGLWRLDCVAERGQSGGPVLYGTGAARRIVAVTVAATEKGSIAVPVDGWLRRAATQP